jgi:hypothetical protein
MAEMKAVESAEKKVELRAERLEDKSVGRMVG